MSKKYLDYDPEKGETVEIEEEKITYDFKEEPIINEEDLIDYQIKKIIEDEKNKKTSSYIDENINSNNLIAKDMREKHNKSYNEDYDEIIDDIYNQKKEELEKKYISKEEAIDEDFTFKANYEEKLSPIKKFLIKRKLKKQQKKESKANRKKLDKDKKEKSKEPVKNEKDEKSENKKDNNEEKKNKINIGSFIKKIFGKLFILMVFGMLIILIVNFILGEETVEKTPLNTNNNNVVTNQPNISTTKTPIVNTKPSVVDRDILLSFVKYLDKCETIIAGMIVISNEESEVFVKYLNSEVSRAEIIKYYQQSMKKKEQLDLLFEDSNVHSEYAELYDIVKKRLRESINITKGTLYNFNNFQKAEVLQTNINKYIQTDRDLANKQKDILVSLFDKFNIDYKLVDGDLLYDTYSVLE